MDNVFCPSKCAINVHEKEQKGLRGRKKGWWKVGRWEKGRKEDERKEYTEEQGKGRFIRPELQGKCNTNCNVQPQQSKDGEVALDFPDLK